MDTKPSVPSTAPRVARLQRGDRVDGAVLLVESSNFKQTRNQKFFIQMQLRDSTGAIKALRWEANEELYRSFTPGDFLRVSGRIEEFQQQLQLIVDRLERVEPDEVDHENFLPSSSRDVGEMEQELRAAIGEVGSPELQKLLLAVVDDDRIRTGLLRCPAGKALHHAYVGGLLEHIVSLLGSCRKIAAQYPQLNRDLLYAGAILHDIGKVGELSYKTSFSYTDRGQLLGHIALGLLLVEEKARAIPSFPSELLLHVQHIIVSHHGEAEFGAMKPPMTAEAIAFHYLDNLDAKLSTLRLVEDALPGESSPGESRWSDFKPHLGRKIFFPGQG